MTIEIIHNEYCRKAAEAAQSWMKEWPNHCPKCRGNGYHHTPATWWEPEDFDSCKCLSEGHCPRCQGLVEFNEQTDITTCPVCGWNDESLINRTATPAGFICPEYDCTCWEDSLPDYDPREDQHLESYYEERNGEGFEDF